jgi:hypothetical protein
LNSKQSIAFSIPKSHSLLFEFLSAISIIFAASNHQHIVFTIHLEQPTAIWDQIGCQDE